MMNELAQTGIFFNGSAGGKGAASAKAAPGLQAKEPARSGKGSFLAVFRETCQRQGRKSVSGRIRSRGSEKEEAPNPRADRDEGETAGFFAPAWFLFGDAPDWAAAPDGAGPVSGSRLAEGEPGSANSLQGEPVPADAGFTGENFLPGIKAEAEIPLVTGPWTEPDAAVAQPTPGVAGEVEPVQEGAEEGVQEGNSRLAVVAGTASVPEQAPAHAMPAGDRLTGETGGESPERSRFILEQNAPGEQGRTGKHTGTGEPEVGGGVFASKRANQVATATATVSEEVRTGPADGRRGRESDPHLPAGEKIRAYAIPAFSGEQLEVENEEQGLVFSVPGKANARTRATAGAAVNKEDLEVLAAGRLPAETARTNDLPAVEETGANQGERSPGAEKVMNQILQGARLMVKNGVAHMHLELRPPELGRLQLALVVEGEIVTARFTAESQTVQALIEANLPELRSALQEVGLQVDQLQVEVGTGDGSQSGAFGQFLPEDYSSGPERRELDGLEMAFFGETGDEEGIREEAAWLGRVNLRV